MADPVSIGAMALSAGGGIVQGIGAKFSGDANAAAYQYKAGVALLNKQISQQNAQWALETGDIKGEEEGFRAKQEKGQTLVTQAASGLDVTSGSAATVRDTQDKVAAFDQGVIHWDAAKTAWGFQAKAATDQAEATLDTTAAATAKEAGTISEIGSFIGAAGSVASKWYQGKSTGLIAR